MLPYHIHIPEEVVDQPFSLTETESSFDNQKEKNFFDAKIINEIFSNYSKISQESSQLNVFKNIIIPKFSQIIFKKNQNLINSKMVFDYYESLSNLFLSKYKTYFSSIQFPQRPKKLFKIEVSEEFDVDSPENFIEKMSAFDFSQFSFKKKRFNSEKIINLIDNNCSNVDVLIDSFLFSIFNSDLTVFLKSFDPFFSLKLNDIQKVSNFERLNKINQKEISIDQNSLHQRIEFTEDLLQSFIIHENNSQNITECPKSCILAANRKFLLAFNHYVDEQNQVIQILKVKLSTRFNDDENQFKRIQYPFNSKDFQLISIGNDTLIYDSHGNIFMFDSISNTNENFIPIKQTFFSRLLPPFTSDGKLVYSLMSMKDIGVFEFNRMKKTISLIRRIRINCNDETLESSFKKAFYKKCSLVTNGNVLQLVCPEKIENSRFVHFSRVISLVNGNIIEDFRFELPFPIHSISFDHFSRCIWTLTLENQRVVFNQFRYVGPDPFWMANIDVKHISTVPKMISLSSFVNFIIDYVHSYVCKCFGSEQNPDFLISSINAETFGMILNMLSKQYDNIQIIQILFVLLEYQIKSVKITDDQFDSLYDIIRQYFKLPFLYNFLTLFIIHVAPFIRSKDISRYFGLIFDHFDVKTLNIEFIYSLLLRLEKSKKFPFVLDNNCPMILHDVLTPMNNENNFNIGLDFLLSYQSSLFLNYTRIYQSNIKKLEKIEAALLGYTSFFFCKMINLIQNIESIESFESSKISFILKRLLINLRITSNSSTFTSSLLPILLEILKGIIKSDFFNEKANNPLYLIFMNIFSLYTYYFKNLIACSNINCLKKHFKFLNTKLEQEKNVSDVFDDKLNDDDFAEVINKIYSKVSNPLNKHLSQEDKELEKLMFLAIVFKSQQINEIIEISTQIKSQKNVQIMPLIRKIMQIIYRIRSNLRLKRQNGNKDEYEKMKNEYIEKSHFLLRVSSNKFELNEINDFICNKTEFKYILQEHAKLESIKRNIDLFIPMANSFITQIIPINLIYLFITNIFDKSSILETFELVKDSVKIDLKSASLIIKNVINGINDIPINTMISFLCNLLLLLTTSYDEREIHSIIFDSLQSMISRLCSESSNIERKNFKACISVLAHFNRILNDKKKFIINDDEKEIISKEFDKLDLKYSVSYTFAHSLHLGKFKSPQSLNIIKQIFGFVDQPKFHSFSLLLLDYFQVYSERKNENEFISLLTQIMDTIGTVISGLNTNNLLQIAFPISQIEKATENAFVRTPTSQFACILDLIQIIRKLILMKESDSSRFVLKYFKRISENLNFDDSEYMKQLLAMLAIMSNVIEVMRPYTIVKTSENKSYFVISVDERKQTFEGLLLPLSNEVIKHEINMSKCIRSYEIIQSNFDLFNEFEIPHLLFKKAIKIEKKKMTDWLFSFFVFHCIKENILDLQHGREFSEFFFSKMKIKANKKFMFNHNSDMILSLLKKSLSLPTNFPLKQRKQQMHHVSFTQLVFNDDYSLTENEIKAIKSPHVFISSVINDEKPTYFSIKYENEKQLFNFGIITHSVEMNKTISISYSSKNSSFYINGEKAVDFKLELNSTIECCYYPNTNIVSFNYSNGNSCLFSCDLGNDYQCSFFVLIYPETSINYFFDEKPQINDAQIDIDKDKTFKLAENKFDEESNDIILYSKDMKRLKYQYDEILINHTKYKELYTLSSFDELHETNILMAEYKNAFYSSLKNVCSSSTQLEKYLQVDEVSGRFNFLKVEKSTIESNDSIPALNVMKYYNLPPEIVNYYISEACKNHSQEIFTLLTVRALANSKNIGSFINQFFITKSAIINFITSILLLLEPINQSKLNESRSPIDFNSFNSFETCAKTDLYDYFIPLNKLISYFKGKEKEKIIKKWFKKLKKDFHNKYMHFASSKNKKCIIVKSLIKDSYQKFEDNENTSGWIIFQFKFGCYKMPSFTVKGLSFPDEFSNEVNYSYIERKVLKIKKNSNDSIPFGILPFSDRSNESLFYTFYHLVVSFKYFVLFAKNDMSNEMKSKLWKLVFNSIIAGSPFFYTHSDSILSFLHDNLPLNFSPDNISLLNSLSISNSIINQMKIQPFLHQQSCLYYEMQSKKIFDAILNSETLSPNEKLPGSVIPINIDLSFDTGTLFNVVARVLLSKNSNESAFPYHLVLNEWAEAFFNYPPCKISPVGTNIVSIKFTAFVPHIFQLICDQMTINNNVQISPFEDFRSYKTCQMSCIKTGEREKIKKIESEKTYYVKLTNLPVNDISQSKFTVYSYNFIGNYELTKLIHSYKSFLISDLNEWSTKFTFKDDHRILNKAYFNCNLMSTRTYSLNINSLEDHVHPSHQIFLRSIYLFTLNYLLLNTRMAVPGKLNRFISFEMISKRFLELIYSKSGHDHETLRINRQNGHDYRNGLCQNDENSMIGQFSKEYVKNPSKFRNVSVPFYIVYLNEKGIDGGGLRRDFISELVSDINSPQVGLFIQTPNGRNHEGSHQECVIPSAKPEISKSDTYYHSIGALIAIIVRTGMKQSDLLFPPLFWKFLVEGCITIDDIYGIDLSYKKVTSNLISESKKMTEKEFDDLIASTTILNLRGKPIVFDFLNTNKLKRENCERFVATCNELRVDELTKPLKCIRDGFWENLNIKNPPFVNSSLMEYLACGNKIISVDDLKQSVTFSGVSDDQKGLFWEVVSRFNNDERKKLLLFSTGLNTISKNGLRIVSSGNEVDAHLPMASTCFFTLNLPLFSSADKMYNAFKIAINETGTFENS